MHSVVSLVCHQQKGVSFSPVPTCPYTGEFQVHIFSKFYIRKDCHIVWNKIPALDFTYNRHIFESEIYYSGKNMFQVFLDWLIFLYEGGIVGKCYSVFHSLLPTHDLRQLSINLFVTSFFDTHRESLSLKTIQIINWLSWMKLIQQKQVAGFVVTALYFIAHILKCGLENMH